MVKKVIMNLDLSRASGPDCIPVVVLKNCDPKCFYILAELINKCLKVGLHLCKSSIHSCMEYFCHVWAGAPSYYLELLDKLQKLICRTIGPSLAASLEPLAHRQNVAISPFYGYYFGRCSLELAQMLPLPFS